MTFSIRILLFCIESPMVLYREFDVFILRDRSILYHGCDLFPLYYSIDRYAMVWA